TTLTVVEGLSAHAVFAPARRKTRLCEGTPVVGWSGVALVSRVPWQAYEILSLPCDRRDGDRVALVARTELDGQPLVGVSLHLTDLHDRAPGRDAAQLTRLGPALAVGSARPTTSAGRGDQAPCGPSDALRLAQLRCILAHPWLSERRALRLLCGDFNTPP